MNDVMENPLPAPDMVLCIPGPWADRGACVEAVMKSGGGYVALGEQLLHVASKFKCGFEFHGPDPAMQQAFRAAGPHWRGSAEMDGIGDHRSVVYLVGRGGSREAAEAMIRAAGALVEAGGLGVKCESSGLAHAPAKWCALVDNLYLFSAHEALVIYVTGTDVYSCGMHLLGWPDAITSSGDQATGAELVREFTRYMFREAPVLLDGHTFAAAASAPGYRLQRDPGVAYGVDSLFANPYGNWRLVPMDAAAPPARKRWWH